MQIMLITMQILHELSFVNVNVKTLLTNLSSIRIMQSVATKGAWCNGNTWVSKTFVEGSNPSAPAKTRPPPQRRGF